METDRLPFTQLLSQIIDNRGRTCPVADEGIPLIATNCIVNDRLFPVHQKVRFVSEHTYRTWFRGHPEPGDIIFVCKGSPGNVAIAPDPVGFCIAQDMVAVRADDTAVYPRFLFAALRSADVRAQIATLHVGTLIPHFKKGDFDKLLIPVPARSHQRFIGDLYFEMSAKIEMNRRCAALLHELLQASWKLVAAGISPVKVGKLIELEKGVSYKGDQLGSGPPLVNLANFGTDGRFNHKGLKRYAGDVRERHWVRRNDLVIANTDLTQRREILGQPAFVEVDEERALYSHHVYAVRPKSGQDCLLWLYAAFRDRSFRNRAMTFASGTTVTALPRDAVLTYDVPWPADDIRTAWQGEARRYLSAATAFDRESRIIATLRDTLLPKLLSGELQVRDPADRDATV